MRRTITVAIVLTLALVGSQTSAWAQNDPEAGFITLEANNFYFHTGSYFNRIALRSSPARIWYVYQPADVDPASKPLFVFFNGGPGGATSAGLLTAYTGRNAVYRDETSGEATIIPNPASWTTVGNLLHIDSRTAGFSYSLMDAPENEPLRKSEFDSQNYNPFTDGADFLRVVLRFLSAHPEIQGNRVILVPESYGGIRTIVMLHFLLYHEKYADGSAVYQDPALVEEIRNHFETVFPEYSGRTVPPGTIAEQFSHQILIQTALSWPYQRYVAVRMLEAPGSILHQLGDETGIPYVPFRDQSGADPDPTPNEIQNYIYDYLETIGRDPYICSKPDGFFNGHFEAAADFLTEVATLNLIIGVDAAGIPEMYAAAREEAYKTRLVGSEESSGQASSRLGHPRIPRRLPAKPSPSRFSATRRRPSSTPTRKSLLDEYDLSSLIGPAPDQDRLLEELAAAEEADLAALFGTLQPWDRFFLDLNYDVSTAFSLNRLLFLGHNVAFRTTELYGRMFLENVAWVETFLTDAAFDIVVFSPAIPEALSLHTDILAGVQHDTLGPPGSLRPGEIVLDFRPESVPGSSVATRTLRFPRYTLSGHAVTMTEPLEMLADVITWLEQTGISGGGGRTQ